MPLPPRGAAPIGAPAGGPRPAARAFANTTRGIAAALLTRPVAAACAPASPLLPPRRFPARRRP